VFLIGVRLKFGCNFGVFDAGSGIGNGIGGTFMFVVMGASGHTGQVVANNLLAGGQKVRVVGRNTTRLKPLTAKGAEGFIADVTDAGALSKAFHQAEAAYVLIPPNPGSTDPLGYMSRVSDAIVAAVQKAGVKNVVSLSSLGAEKSSGTGPVVGLHHLEQKLNQIADTNVLHLRAGSFMENTLPQVNAIRQMGAVATPLRADLKLPMVATRDIGAVASEALLHPTVRGKQTRELLGQRDLTYTEAAAIIGKAIGTFDLKYMQAPDDQFRAVLLQMGMSEQFAKLLLEMNGALNSGSMRSLEPRTPQNTTPTNFETFVAEYFVPAYQQQAAA
jgi:uncharacterized protein YbjT (DUF2867 family)